MGITAIMGSAVNAETINKLFTAVACLDEEAIVSCYAENTSFKDHIYDLKGKEQVAGMWRMLCESQKRSAEIQKEWQVNYRDVKSTDTTGSVHWEADYLFS